MRQKTARASWTGGRTERVADSSARPWKPFGPGLLGWIAVALLLGRPALADPSENVDSIILAALPAAISLSVSDRPLPVRAGAVAEKRPAATASPHVAETFRDPEVADLTQYEVPWRAPTTDEALVAAVALGSNPDLEPKKPFRKRSNDLFRTERPVEIGNSQMLLRLRLRPQSRETMSLELRF